jgi:hypothetical protein
MASSANSGGDGSTRDLHTHTHGHTPWQQLANEMRGPSFSLEDPKRVLFWSELTYLVYAEPERVPEREAEPKSHPDVILDEPSHFRPRSLFPFSHFVVLPAVKNTFYRVVRVNPVTHWVLFHHKTLS